MIDALTRRWRWPLYALLVYLPVSGVAILAAYPGRTDRAIAILAKDFVFVIPAYLLFLGYCLLHRKRPWFKGAPLVLIGLLALIVVIQAFNPDLPNHLVGLIGIKVWLFYIPLFFLGYHLVRNREHLFRVLGLMSLLAIVPAVIGLSEVTLYYTGHAQTVYDVYGESAASATQNFTTFVLSGGCTIRRVPSTFSFFYQYYLFGAAMVAVSFAWWRGARPAGKQLWAAGLVFLLIFLAAMFSGARLAFIVIPLLVAAIIVLAVRSRNRLPWAAVAAAVVCLALVGGTAAGICGLAAHLGEATSMETRDVGVRSVREAVHKTWLGLGTGSDSTAARYAFPNVELQTSVGAVQESWYVKAYLELGVFGLAIAVALLGTIVYRAARVHFRLRDPRLKMVSAAVLALMGWVLIYCFKAQYFDLDPINVYFWLFAGILMSLPRLERQKVASEPAEPEAEQLPAPV
jgi:O-Antigen ligase